MSRSLTAVQYFKDRIQLILMAPESQFDPDAIVEMLFLARDQMLEMYENGHPHLTKVNADVLHGAKDLAVEVTMRTHEALTDARGASALPEPIRAYLGGARLALCELQERLREERDRALMLRCFQ